ncbi:PREDICTED: putative expansin-B14 [Ipomoea nil]|uniref:putative expansin-B14 n=1 Tax=Ipomoea nil TaxID=35883 RepID=UPI000901BAB9|nr:PREDICTED: putative expansin-B14 [Ipomoea nil]
MTSSHHIVLVVFFTLFNFCLCINSFNNITLAGFAPATATWYDPPNGRGTDTGACGFGNVGNPPYNSLIAAGNQALYQHGKGCGQCYEVYKVDDILIILMGTNCTFLVKCNSNPQCSGNPIKIHITDECPSDCNSVPVWFDLSGIAFGALAKSGQADALRNAGKIKIS